jgi:hypothetical protein
MKWPAIASDRGAAILPCANVSDALEEEIDVDRVVSGAIKQRTEDRIECGDRYAADGDGDRRSPTRCLAH